CLSEAPPLDAPRARGRLAHRRTLGRGLAYGVQSSVPRPESKLLGSLRSPVHVAALGSLRASVPVPLAQRLAIGPGAHALVVGRPHLLDSVSEAAQPGRKHAAGGLPPHDRRLRALVP